MSRILIVDDEAIITMQLGERLAAMGYTVAGMATTGEAAVQKAREERPDLVLMDIVMPGKMNGIEAAGIITGELLIPVVFVTSYADDTIIENAKSVGPAGYILKPFNEREIKAAIEVALFKKALVSPAPAGEDVLQAPEESGARGFGSPESRYLDLSAGKTVLLDDIFSEIVLFLYTDPVAREPVFRFALDEGIRKGGRNFFAYARPSVQRHFSGEIQAGRLHTRRMKRNEIFSLLGDLEACIGSLPAAPGDRTLKILLDFGDSDEYADILAIKKFLLAKRADKVPVSGILALDIGDMDHDRISELARNIPRVIVSNGRDTALSFAYHSFAPEAMGVVAQGTIDDIVKKSLEPVVLSLLDRPISGFEIVHEIHNRYNVLIPQARVYTLLYDLQQNGYLEIRMSGKSKLYSPTEAGKKYIPARLNDFRTVYRHILGGGGSGK